MWMHVWDSYQVSHNRLHGKRRNPRHRRDGRRAAGCTRPHPPRGTRSAARTSAAARSCGGRRTVQRGPLPIPGLGWRQMISAMVPESASNISGAVVQVPHICLCREEEGVGDNPLHPPYRPKMVPSSHWLYSVTTVRRKRATAGVEERRTYCRRVAGGGWSPPPPTPSFRKGPDRW